MNSTPAYEQLDALFNAGVHPTVGFAMHLGASRQLGEGDRHVLERQDRAVRKYLMGLLAIQNAVIAGTLPEDISRLIYGDCPKNMGPAFHSEVPPLARDIPQFFRTDNTTIGKVSEVQCPGSMWGEALALQRLHLQRISPIEDSADMASAFVEAVNSRVAEPYVLHLLDNASLPVGMHYFIAATRPYLRYFGLDGLGSEDCNFIRSHSFQGLVAENLFKKRLALVQKGKAIFDLPPLCIFDQKVPLSFPFGKLTSSFFDEEVRLTINPTTVVMEDGLLFDGLTHITEFSRLPRSSRDYYLKYGGMDTSINWGGRAVYRLSNDTSAVCLQRLISASQDAAKGRYWVLQKTDAEKSKVIAEDRNGCNISGFMNMGYRFFYTMGTRSCGLYLARHNFKVHGQWDTICGLVV